MTTDRRQRVLELYHQALRTDTAGRDAFLLDACAGDDELHRQVRSLLAQDPPENFLGALPDDAARDLIGRQIGPYRVESQLGAGGMGEVFRAHDTKLGRDVAIKILPRVFGADPERRARFEREARVLATLNHPHIGAIYGLEDAGGVPALVLELVDGETLVQHLRSSRQSPGRGLPVAHAVAVAQQIAEALEAAHEKGIVHRDLKPGNVVFTADGSVKVLDFGLAKAMSDSGLEPPVADTRTGVVMGTPAYMSPEQAKGAKVDKRADIWAFGCVLFEMLTGRPAFSGETMAETLAAVLHEQPAWETVPAETPLGVRLVLMQCLQKDPKQRLRDVGDVKLGLTGVFTSDAARAIAPPAAPARGSLWRRAAPAIAALLVGVLVTAAAMRLSTSRPALAGTRLSLGATGTNAVNVNGNERDLTITPDGSRVVYVGDGGRQIFVRALDQLEPISLATGAVLRNPFVSPDGQWVGFGEDLFLIKKIPISGGPPTVVARVDSIARGAAWLPDNTIVFATNRTAGLQRVSADGGKPTMLTKPDDARNEYAHLWPQLLPDGRALLYTALARTGGLAAAKVRLLDLQTNTSSDLLDGASNAMYVSSGHLVYVAGATLWAVPFDLGRRATFGTALPILNPVVTTGNGAGLFATSTTGTLVYAHASGFDPLARTLNWIDRQGRVEMIPAPPKAYAQPRLSHDGTRVVAATVQDPEDNLWVWDLTRRILTRITTDAALDVQPIWTPDDRWIWFGSNRLDGLQSIWRQASDGTGNPEQLTHAALPQVDPAVTPDGQQVLFSELTAGGGGDIMQLTPATGQVRPVVRDRFTKLGGEVSPDGRWLAYNSNRSGREEIYVQPYPIADGARGQVSTGGGRAPAWARDGRELFYVTPDNALMSVAVRAAGSTWRAGQPAKVLEPGYWSRSSFIARNYDPAPDGQRFLVLGPPPRAPNPPELVVVQHWDEELRARVPSK